MAASATKTKAGDHAEAGVSDDEAFEIIVRHLKQEEPQQAFFRFNKRVQTKQYEPAEAAVSIPFTVNQDDTDEDILAKGRAAALSAKALVYSELGLDMVLEEREGATILTEVVRRELPGSEIVQGGSSIGVGPTPPFDPQTTDRDQRSKNEDWGKARFASHPDEFYDNRPGIESGKMNPKAPKVKHKTTGIAVWSL